MNKFLGKFLKGWATWGGLGVAVAATAFGAGGGEKAFAVHEGVAGILQQVGAISMAFGYGRKTGYAANPPERYQPHPSTR